MRIVAKYSINKGVLLLKRKKGKEFSEALEAVRQAKLKKGKLHSPAEMGKAILDYLYARGWSQPKIALEIPGNFITGDAMKNNVGVELQFGKYSFLGWDTLRKMSLFAAEGTYEYGIEIAPMASLRRKMSKGVGSFEQLGKKLKEGSKAGLKIPAVVLGIDI